MTINRWVRARPVLWFCALTFVIGSGAWWPMAAYNHGLLDIQLPALFFIGGLGPGIAAYLVMMTVHGPSVGTDLLKTLLRWRVGWGWFLVALLLTPTIWVLSTTLSGTWNSALAALGSVGQIALALARYLLAAVPEEVGWRGFLLPALQKRFSALTSSLLVGLVWFLWHLPLVFGGDPHMSTFPLVPYVVWFLAISVLYTWLYNNTRGSLLIVVLVHAMSNIFGVFSAAPWVTVGVTAGLALIVVVIFGPRDISRTSSRITQA